MAVIQPNPLQPVGDGGLDQLDQNYEADDVIQPVPNEEPPNVRRRPSRPPLQATLDRRAAQAATALLGDVPAPRLRSRPPRHQQQRRREEAQARREVAQARRAAAQARRGAAQARHARHPRAAVFRAKPDSDQEYLEMAEIDEMLQAVINQPIGDEDD